VSDDVLVSVRDKVLLRVAETVVEAVSEGDVVKVAEPETVPDADEVHVDDGDCVADGVEDKVIDWEVVNVALAVTLDVSDGEAVLETVGVGDSEKLRDVESDAVDVFDLENRLKVPVSDSEEERDSEALKDAESLSLLETVRVTVLVEVAVLLAVMELLREGDGEGDLVPVWLAVAVRLTVAVGVEVVDKEVVRVAVALHVPVADAVCDAVLERRVPVTEAVADSVLVTDADVDNVIVADQLVERVVVPELEDDTVVEADVVAVGDRDNVRDAVKEPVFVALSEAEAVLVRLRLLLPLELAVAVADTVHVRE
jgi:hypothetical protein